MLRSLFRIRLPSRAPWLGPFLVAVGLRLAFLDFRPLWYDEAFGVLLARRGWEGIATATWRALIQGHRGEHHTPLFYLLQSAWIRVFGDSVASVRLMAVLLSLAAWWAAWQLVHRWLPPRAARLAGWLLALSPFQVHYAQEARMYSLLALAALSTLLFFDWALEWNRPLLWFAAAWSATLLLYTHNAAVLYLVPWSLAGGWWAWRKGRAKPFLAAALSVGLLYLPWAWVLRIQVGHVQRAYWIPRPGLKEGVNTLVAFASHVPMLGWSAMVALFIALVLTATGLHTTWRYRAQDGARLSQLGLAFLTPWAFMFLVSQWLPVYLVRLLLPVGMLYLFWMAWVLVHPQVPRVVRGGLLALTLFGFLLGFRVHWTYQGFPYAPYEALGAWLQAHRAPGDLVLHANKLTYLPMVYTTPALPQAYLPDPPGSGSDTLSPMMRRGLGIPDPITLESLAQRSLHEGSPGLWFLVFPREIEDYRAIGKPHPSLSWLQDHFCTRSRQTWGDLWVFEFRPCSKGP